MAHNERHAFVDVSTLLGPVKPSLEALLQAEQAHQKAERIKAGIQDRVVDVDTMNRNPELGFISRKASTTIPTEDEDNPTTGGIKQGELIAVNKQKQADERTIIKSLLSSSSNGGPQPTKGWDRLFATLERMGGRGSGAPIGTSGFNAFLGDFVGSSQELRADEAQAGLTQQEQQNALAIERAKLANKEVKLPTLTGEARKVIDEYYYGVQGVNLITAMEKSMLSGVTSGAPGSILAGFNYLLTAAGLGVKATTKQEMVNLASQLKATMAASGIFGRETSRTEFNELVDKLVETPGLVDSEQKVAAALRGLSKRLQDQVAQAWRISQQYGIPLKGIATNKTPSHIENIEKGTP